jgi:dGTPase
VAGLAHDIGHPPFGHAAESELQKILHAGKTSGGATSRQILRDSFEGNAQTFRIVAKLSLRKHEATNPRQDGLNLTWRSLAAISKYPWCRGKHPTAVPKLASKWSFYESEQGYGDQLAQAGFILALEDKGKVSAIYRSIESEVMDWADDIAYAVHDLEDFHRSGRISLDRIVLMANAEVSSNEFEEILQFALKKINEVPDMEVWEFDDLKSFLMDAVIEYMPDAPFTGSRISQSAIQAFSSEMIRQLQSECDVEEQQARFQLRVGRNGRTIAEFLKTLTQFFVINDSMLETMQYGQRKVISDLFHVLHEVTVDAMIDHGGSKIAQRRLPARLREYAHLTLRTEDANAYSDDEARTARAVIDFLCSLTDKQAGYLHQRLTGDAVSRLSPYWLNL